MCWTHSQWWWRQEARLECSTLSFDPNRDGQPAFHIWPHCIINKPLMYIDRKFDVCNSSGATTLWCIIWINFINKYFRFFFAYFSEQDWVAIVSISIAMVMARLDIILFISNKRYRANIDGSKSANIMKVNYAWIWTVSRTFHFQWTYSDFFLSIGNQNIFF